MNHEKEKQMTDIRAKDRVEYVGDYEPMEGHQGTVREVGQYNTADRNKSRWACVAWDLPLPAEAESKTNVLTTEHHGDLRIVVEKTDTIWIEHTLHGVQPGDEVWWINLTPKTAQQTALWPAKVVGLSETGSRIRIEYLDGGPGEFLPSLLTKTPPLPPEPPVWTVVTVDEGSTDRTFVRKPDGWYSTGGLWYSDWASVCALDVNRAPTTRKPEEEK